METNLLKIDAQREEELPKQTSLNKVNAKKILFVLDYANNQAFRENISHIPDDKIEDYLQKKYG